MSEETSFAIERIEALAEQISEVQSDLTEKILDVASNVSRLKSDIGSFRNELRSVERQIETLQHHLKQYQQPLAEMAESLVESAKTLREVNSEIGEQSKHEQVHRREIDEKIWALQAAQATISKTIKEGFSQTASQVQVLRDKEAAFGEQLAQSLQQFKALVLEADRHLRGQMDGIREEVVAMDDEEREWTGKTTEAFEKLIKEDKNLGAVMSELRLAGEGLSANLQRLVRAQDGRDGIERSNRAIEVNDAGLSLLNTHDFAGAAQNFLRASKDDPSRAEFKFNLAVALFLAGDIAEATRLSAELLGCNQIDVDARLLHALAVLSTGKFADAVAILGESNMSDGVQQHTALLLGTGQLLAGLVDKGKAAFNIAQTNSGYPAEALRRFGMELATPAN